MASHQPPRRSSWKDSANAPAARGPAGPERAWKQSAEESAGGKGFTRQKKILSGVALLVVLLGLFIWVIWWLLPPRGATLVLLGSGYEENLALPHNVQGMQGLNDLAALAGPNRGDLKVSHGPAVLQPLPERWIESWDKPSESKLVIFLALHGGVDEKGPFLFLDDPAADQKHRLYMDQVLDHLQSDAFKNKQTLLILDPTQLSCDWRTGQLQNDFPERIKQLFEERKPRDLYVLVASQSGQRSWVSEEWGRSIFAHSVIEGLRGAADSNKNNRVTVLELAEHVEKAVPAWVQSNRDAVQKPLFLGDRDLARKVELVSPRGEYQEPKPPSRSLNEGMLADYWQRVEQFRSQVPSPAVYTPQVWRGYLETLLRLEQVVRSGDPTGKTSALQRRLTDLEDEMNRVRRQPWESMTAALPMGAALGTTPTWTPQEVEQQRKALTGGKPLNRESWGKLLEWAGAHSADSSVNRRLLYVHMLHTLLHAIRDRKRVSPEDLREAMALIDLFESDEEFRRPVEGHYFKLLARDLEPDEAARAWKALDVRLQAEQAALGVAEAPASRTAPARRRHLYSEVVWLWIATQIQLADRTRQDGENLVLAPRSADKAEEHFRQAEDEYRKARDDADTVRDALALRDRVLTELPYYSQWVSRQRTIGGSETAEQTQLVRQHEDLWQAVHELSTALDEPAPQPPASPAEAEGYRKKLDTQLKNLKDRTDKVAGAFKSVVDAFSDHVENLPISVEIQKVWHDIEDTLSVPFIAAERRKNLINASRNGAARFNSGEARQSGQARADSEASQEAVARARREALLALAILGPERLRDFKDLRDQVSRGEVGTSGPQFHKRWLALKDDADAAIKESLKAGDLVTAAKQARSAENIGRLMDGAAAARLPAGQVGPVEAARRLRLHDFLLWQVKRTATDHLFDDSGRDPYYLPAGETFANDAARLVEVPDERLSEQRAQPVKAARAEHLQRSMIAVQAGSLNRTVTDQRRDRIIWKLVPDKGVPEGNPVVWLDPVGKVSAANADQTKRQPLVGSFPQQFDTQLEVQSLAPREQSKVTLRGRYRGQILDTTVQFINQSDTELVIHRLPPPPKSSLAIRAGEGVQVGSIVIVFDASGSMATPVGQVRRYDLAMQSLEKVLGELYRRRLGVSVHLWAFGDGDDDSTAKRLRVGGGTDWEPADLVKRAKAIRLRGVSPIAETMVDALEDIKNARGFRTMLVLTDGDDNILKEGVDAYLQEQFKAKGCEDVLINMALFQPTDSEVIEKQFRYIKKAGGTFGKAEDTTQLDRLLEVLSPKANLVNAPKEPEIPISFQQSQDRKTGTDLRWSRPITPATYRAELYRTPLQPQFELTEGDRLLLGVRAEGRKLIIRRMLFGEEERPRVSRLVSRPDDYFKTSGDWLASVVHNEFLPQTRELYQTLAIENARAVEVGKDEVLRQIRPGFRWIEVQPRGGETKPGTINWWNEGAYPGPAYGVRVDRWPTRPGGDDPQEPELTVWWDGGERGPHPPSDAEMKIEGVGNLLETEVEGTKLNVSTSWEADRQVTVNSRFGTAPREALVIRVEPAKGGKFPVWARVVLSGGDAEGEEHYYYSNGQYTAVFWGVSQPRTKSFTLHLSSVDKFKRNAAHREVKFRLDDPRRTKIPAPLMPPPGE